MKKTSKDKWEGIKWRSLPEYNYLARWENLVTMRFNCGKLMELPADQAEFYDVSLGTLCAAAAEIPNGNCSFCCVSAGSNGREYKNVCETWEKWMSTFPEDKYDERGVCLTAKPCQIAIGSQGDPCDAFSLPEFLQVVYETNVVPNYTTNGVVLSAWDNTNSKWHERALKILDATSKYCGGVAVSFGNKALRKYAEKAIEGLFKLGDCHVMIHHIISDRQSVDDFVECWRKYGDKIRNHVLLPLMPAGRSKSGVEDGVFEYLEEVINGNGIQNVAFGAHFINRLKDSSIKTWLYPAETYSKNVLLQDGKVVITRSSFDLKPIKIIKI